MKQNYETHLFRTNLKEIIKFFTIETKNDGEEYIPAIFTHSGMKYTGNDPFLQTFNYSRTADNGYSSFLVSQRNSKQEYLLLGNTNLMAYYDEDKDDFSSSMYVSFLSKYLNKMSIPEYQSNIPNVCLITDNEIYELDGKKLLSKWSNKEFIIDNTYDHLVWIKLTDDVIIRKAKKTNNLSKVQEYRYNDLKKAIIANKVIKGTEYINFYAGYFDKVTGESKTVMFSTIKQFIKANKSSLSERTIKRRIKEGGYLEIGNYYVVLGPSSDFSEFISETLSGLITVHDHVHDHVHDEDHVSVISPDTQCPSSKSDKSKERAPSITKQWLEYKFKEREAGRTPNYEQFVQLINSNSQHALNN